MCKCTPEIRTPYCGRGNCINQHDKPQGARSQLPQDVEEFVAETCEEIDETGFAYVPVDDLRAWMTGHVRVPVELLKAAQCPECDGSGAYYDGMGGIYQCRWCHEVGELLNASKEE